MKRQLTYLTLVFYLIVNSASFASEDDAPDHIHEGSHKKGSDHEGSHREGSHKKGSDHEGSHSQKGQKAELQTVTGEVVDLSCYLDHKAKGPSHKQCAISCAKKGLPMGILTKNNSLYLVLENHDNASAYKETTKHAAETVIVKGKVYNLGGIQAIKVAEVKPHH